MSLSPACKRLLQTAEKKGLPISTWTLLMALSEVNQDVRIFITPHLATQRVQIPKVKEPVSDAMGGGLFTRAAYRVFTITGYEAGEGEIEECRHFFQALAKETEGQAGLYLRQLPWETAQIQPDAPETKRAPKSAVGHATLFGVLGFATLHENPALHHYAYPWLILIILWITRLFLVQSQRWEGSRSGKCRRCQKSFLTPAAYSKKGGYCLPCSQLRAWLFGLSHILTGSTLLAAGFLATCSGHPQEGNILLNLAAWSPLLLVGIIFHELGHALGALIVGWRLWRLELGAGEQGPQFSWRGCSIVIRSHLFAGKTYPIVPNLKDYRLRQAIFTVAGPLANLACGAAALKASLVYHDWTAPSRSFLILPMACLTNLFLGFINLWPIGARSEDSLPSDGFVLRNLCRRSRPAYEITMSNIRHVTLHHAHKYGDWSALKTLLKLEKDAPLDIGFALALQERRWQEAARLYEEIQDDTPIPLETAKNNLAWALLCSGEDLQRAERLISEALEFAPYHAPFRGTLACIQMLTGRETQGAETLRELLTKTMDKDMAAIRAHFLARVDGEWLAVARMLNPACPYEEVARRPQ